jgi:class 3 adenylate cyclase/predicted ATPase
MNVPGWLRILGLEQYEAAFRDNAIDDSVLPKLTAEDLKDLGVTAVGHRRKLLEAIAELRCASKSEPALSEPCATVTAPAKDAAERRQITVMFSDLVGSTALSARMDPEDLREVISAYQKCVAETVGRFRGFVAKYMGDGVLIYFGYPQAHEDDAERAVRAGLELIAGVSALKSSVSLQTRLGIATGMVVVGDLIGSGASQEQAIVGETPNLAARLQGVAEPNSVVIAESTRRFLGNLFELEDLGEQELKGIAAPVRAWSALRPASVESRFEALHTSGLTELVGREEELEILLRRWSKAKSGEGQVVLLAGEPGIGKSRLMAALLERLAGEPHSSLRYFCSPHHSESALYPIIGQLEHAAGFARDDDAGAKRRKLAALLAMDDLALFADLLSLPAEPDAAVDLTPQQKKERTFEAVMRLLDNLARQQPVLMLFEDLQWMDPTSRELLDRTIMRIDRQPVLLIASFRPDFQPPWSGLPYVTMLTLNRFGRREGGALVQRIAGNTALPADLVAEVVERTDGVPLFLEEVTKALLETAGGPNGAMMHGIIAGMPGARVAVPPTLQASLLARLDRFGPIAREVAQTGAAIGREFSYELLTAVAESGEADARAALGQLVAARLLFQRGTPPTADYQFKHALIQDTAYGTLLRSPRQALHGRIAAAIETRLPDRADREPEILAFHLAEAGQSERAAVHWRKAGEQAVRRAATREAIGHFRRALAVVVAQPEGAERWHAELAILSQLATPMMSVYGWAAQEAGEIVERAAEIGRRLDSSREIAPAVANLWIFNVGLGRIDRAEEISADLFRMAHTLDDNEILLQAHHCSWATDFFRGRFREAMSEIEVGLSLYDRERHAHHRHVYLGHDPCVCAMNYGASTRFVLGFPDQACRLAVDGTELARRLDHAPTLANALWKACAVFSMLDEPEAVTTAATELIGLTDVHGLPMPRVHAFIYLGWARARSGHTAEGIAQMEETDQLRTRIGGLSHWTFAQGLRAEALLSAGRHVEALRHAERALATAVETGEHAYLSRLHRIRGVLLLQLRGTADPEVEASLQQALAIAREQDAKGWEICAATALARLWAEQGRRTEAQELLAPIYGWFSEGFATPDLKTAKALLEELV